MRAELRPQVIVIVGFGNIAQACLPPLRKAFGACRIVAFEATPDAARHAIAFDFGVELRPVRVGRENYRAVLGPWLGCGALLVNLATEVSSVALIRLAQAHAAHYLDTCIDPWAYEHGDGGQVISTSNYALREQVLQLARETPGAATAVVAHGANPGFVSVLVKLALEKMAAAHLGEPAQALRDPGDYAAAAERLGVRVIQISECDTQVCATPPGPAEFRSTWSPAGLITEALQPGELGWGSHEPRLPPRARRHAYGCEAAIALAERSVDVRVKSWSPNRLDFDAWLISHNEAVSIADYLTLRAPGGGLRYRPTCYYAYRPCDDASAALARLAAGHVASRHTVAKEAITSGIDELGVFLVSDRLPAVWFGSNLSIARARALAPHNNATSLQVAGSVVAGLEWMLANPAAGVVESEALDAHFIFDRAARYWGPLLYETLDWRPSPHSASLAFDAFRV